MAEVRLAKAMHEGKWPVLRAGDVIILDRTTLPPPVPTGVAAPAYVGLDWRGHPTQAPPPPIRPDSRVAVVPGEGLPRLAG